MSDPNGTLVPEASGAPAAQETKPADKNVEPSWLGERLAREQRSILSKAGFDSLEDAQAASAALKAQREAEKSASEKAVEATQRAAQAESKAVALREAVAQFANQQLAELTPEQKAAVDAVAGDDPAAQIKAIAAFRPTWAKPAAAHVETPAPVSVDTAPGANAPKPLTNQSPDYRAQYESLKKTNPFAAAAFALEHSHAIYGEGT